MDSTTSSKSGESFNGSSDSGEFSSNEEFDEENNNVATTKCGEQRGPCCARGKKFWRRLGKRSVQKEYKKIFCNMEKNLDRCTFFQASNCNENYTFTQLLEILDK